MACGDLLDRLSAHNDKEEPIVYPEVDKISQAAAVLEMLGSESMPAGWVCERATGADPTGTAPHGHRATAQNAAVAVGRVDRLNTGGSHLGEGTLH